MPNIFRPLSWFRAGEENSQSSETEAAPQRERSSGEGEVEASSTSAQSVAGAPETDPQKRPRRVSRVSPVRPPVREVIEQRAYFKWHADGCPAGRDMEYWLAAEAEVLRENSDGPQYVSSDR